MSATRQTLAAAMLHIASQYVGIDRESDPGQIGKFLALFNLPFAAGGSAVPFCAAGTSYAACKAWADANNIPYTAENAISVFRGLMSDIRAAMFYPSASCSAIIADAMSRGTWLGVDQISDDTEIKPGWLVFFQFSPTDRHVEIVSEDEGDTIQTVGFNTACAGHSGVVAEKSRNWEYIIGYVETW